jgi:hypothetical protein
MLFTVLLSLFAISSPPDIDIWVNKEDATYYPNEKLTVFFQVDQDCYVAVYDIEVGGSASMLFPQEGMDGWVEAGRVYELPPADADHDYVIGGAEGIETIIAVGSIEWLPDLDDNGVDVVHQSVEIYIEEPEPAKLRIISTPKRCRIYITEVASGNGVSLGKTPRTIVLRPGEYIVKIKKLGYKTLVRRICLDPHDMRRVFVKLRPY